MEARSMISKPVLVDHVAAVSCGIVNGAPVLDLDYTEDCEADTDANFVLTGSGSIVEIQATAEDGPFAEESFMRLLGLARAGIGKLVEHQRAAVGACASRPPGCSRPRCMRRTSRRRTPSTTASSNCLW
jgi:ribonuclease PH